jgi:hypothetical protein
MNTFKKLWRTHRKLAIAYLLIDFSLAGVLVVWTVWRIL